MTDGILKDPYWAYLHKPVCAKKADGTEARGVLNALSYFYATIGQEVVSRKFIISLTPDGAAR